MKYIVNHVGVFVSIVLLVFTFFLAPSCHKNQDSVAVITVVDSLNRPVMGAVVKLTSSIKGGPRAMADYLPNIQTSGGDGKTYHRFPLEGLLSVLVTKKNLKVVDAVRLKKEDTVYQTIVLK